MGKDAGLVRKFGIGGYLPLFLALLPLIVLSFNSRSMRALREKDHLEIWRQKCERRAVRLKRASRFEFFAQGTANRIRKRFQWLVNRHRGISSSPDRMGKALAAAIKGSAFKGFPSFKVWGFLLPSGTEGRAILAKGPGLQRSFQNLFGGVFQELSKRNLPSTDGGASAGERDAGIATFFSQEPSRFFSGDWFKRVKAVLGVGIGPDLFDENHRGIPFTVLFEGKPQLMVWDIVFLNRRPVGGFFFMVAIPAKAGKAALRMILGNWNPLPSDCSGRVFRGPLPSDCSGRVFRGPLPAFLPFGPEFPPVPKPPIVHPGLGCPEIIRPLESLGTLLRYKPISPPGTPREGFFRLLSPLLGKLIRLGDGIPGSDASSTPVGEEGGGLMGYPVALDPLTGHLGLLVVRVPETPGDPRDFLLKVAFAFWAGLLIRRILGDFLGTGWSPGSVEGQLRKILIGVVALPTVFSIGSLMNLREDIRSNRSDTLSRELDDRLRKIEDCDAEVGREALSSFREVVASLSLLDSIRRDSKNPRNLERIQKEIATEMARREVKASFLNILTFESPCRSFSGPEVSPEGRRMIEAALTKGWLKHLLEIRFVGTLSEELKRPPLIPTDVIATLSLNADVPIVWEGGGRKLHIFRLCLPEPIPGQPARSECQISIAWNQASLYQKYLERVLEETGPGHEKDGFSFAVFRRSGDDLEDVGFSSNVIAGIPGIRDFARQIQGGALKKAVAGGLITGFQSQILPGMVLVGFVSLRTVQEELDVLLMLALVSGLLLVLLVFAGAKLLSRWIAIPVREMAEGLGKVGRGDLETRVSRPRSDELGRTGENLDRMILWLAERERMSRFVTPQVMEVVSGGSYGEAVGGALKEVVVLASDIRSFTTISESQPPEAVFRFLNTHMERMTRPIKSFGGVIDRFIGDAIQAVFYPSRPGEEPPPIRALRAALAMREAHDSLQAERKARGEFRYEIGIGIHEGTVVAGVVGDPGSRLDHSVLGEPIQRAAELEAASKNGSFSKVIVSSAIREEALGSFDFVSLPGSEGWEVREKRGLMAVSSKPASPVDPSGGISLGVQAVCPGRESLSPESFAWGPFLCLWLIPPLLMLGALWSFSHGIESSKRLEAKNALSERLLEAKTNRDPAVLAGGFLEGLGERLLAEGPATPLPRSSIDATIREIGRVFPGSTMMVFKPRLELASVQFSFDPVAPVSLGEDDIEILSDNLGQDFPLPPRDFKRLALFLFCCHIVRGNPIMSGIPFGLDPGMFWFALGLEKLPCFIGENVFRHRFRLFEAFLASKGGLAPITMMGRRFFFHWNMHPSVLAGEGREADPGAPRFGILAFIPAERVTEEVGRELMAARLAEEGWRGMLVPGGMGGDRRPLSFGIPPDKASIEPFRKAVSPGFLRGEVSFDLGGSQTLLLETPDSGPGSPAGKFVWIGLFAICWLGAGGGVVLLPNWWKAAFGSLRRTMVGVFSAVMVPALVMGLLQTQTRSREWRLRLESETKTSVLRSLDSFADGVDLFNGAAVSAVEYACGQFQFRAKVQEWAREGKTREELGSGGPSGFLYDMTHLLGIPLHSVVIVNPDWKTGLNSEKKLFDFLGYIRSNLLKAMGVRGSEASGRKPRLDRAQLLRFEEVMGGMRLVLSPGEFAHFHSAPEALLFGNLKGTSGLTLFSRMLYVDRKVWGVLQVGWVSYVAVCHLLRNLEESLEIDASGVACGVSEIGFPAWEIVSPFLARFHPLPGQSGVHSLNPSLGAQDRGIAAISALAERSGQAVSRVVHGEAGPRLIAAAPMENFRMMTMFGSFPLRKVWVKAEWEAMEGWAVLLGSGFLTLILGFAVAGRFLRPLIKLDEAAFAIRRKDFSVRVPVEGGDEFGSLAASFNRMAEGVEQGRLLSQFVSDSVRDAVKDGNRVEIAREGESLEVVILFIALGSFKDRLKKAAPGEIVAELNSFLELAAASIRDAGGEVDKFVGDKVLAVFHPRKAGSLGNAAGAAFKAVTLLGKGLSGLKPWNESPLGVGMVTGRVLAGILGAAEVRLEYTVIGDPVNLASRLCDLALKRGGGLVSDDVSNGLIGSGFENGFSPCFQPLGEVEVKGKSVRRTCFFLPQSEIARVPPPKG